MFIFVSFAGCAVSLIISGPSYYLGLPNKLWIMCIGLAMQGAFLGLVFIPILPEMIEAIYASKGLTEGEDERTDGVISDKAAGLYGSFYSIGMIISPILGSLVFENFEKFDDTNAFNKTCDLFALATFVYSIIYLIFNII
jgi:MFS family permease